MIRPDLEEWKELKELWRAAIGIDMGTVPWLPALERSKEYLCFKHRELIKALASDNVIARGAETILESIFETIIHHTWRSDEYLFSKGYGCMLSCYMMTGQGVKMKNSRNTLLGRLRLIARYLESCGEFSEGESEEDRKLNRKLFAVIRQNYLRISIALDLDLVKRSDLQPKLLYTIRALKRFLDMSRSAEDTPSCDCITSFSPEERLNAWERILQIAIENKARVVTFYEAVRLLEMGYFGQPNYPDVIE